MGCGLSGRICSQPAVETWLEHIRATTLRKLVRQSTVFELPGHYHRNPEVAPTRDGMFVEMAYTALSSANAIPMPPLTQSVATPRFTLRFTISCSSVTVIRVPVHPMGCPKAIAP